MSHHGREGNDEDRFTCSCSMSTFLSLEELHAVNDMRRAKRDAESRRRKLNEPEASKLRDEVKRLQAQIAELER